MEITDKERKVLNAIAHNYFGNGDASAWVWANCINDSDKPSGINGKALSGVVASLAKKGLVDCDGAGEEAVVRVTAAGQAEVRR